MENKQIKSCPHCGQKMREYKVGLSKLMLNTLIKFREAIVEKGENGVHLLNDFENKRYELTRHEWNNFTRLRFHGLAVKVKEHPGYWLLTKRGADFLNGKVEIPRYVWIRNNRVIDHSEEKVGIRDIIKDAPYIERVEDIVYRSFEPKQGYLL